MVKFEAFSFSHGKNSFLKTITLLRKILFSSTVVFFLKQRQLRQQGKQTKFESNKYVNKENYCLCKQQNSAHPTNHVFIVHHCQSKK